jgi:hypothetical protein
MPSPKTVSIFGFDELVRVPSDYLNAAPPVAKEIPRAHPRHRLALERRGSRRHGLLGRREDVACGRRTRYVLRTLDSKVHPSCIHGPKHFFGRSGVALRDAELPERFRPPCTRDWEGFHVEIQDFTQLLRDFIRGDHRTKLDGALP